MARMEKKSCSGNTESTGYSVFFSILFFPLSLRFKMMKEIQAGGGINAIDLNLKLNSALLVLWWTPNRTKKSNFGLRWGVFLLPVLMLCICGHDKARNIFLYLRRFSYRSEIHYANLSTNENKEEKKAPGGNDPDSTYLCSCVYSNQETANHLLFLITAQFLQDSQVRIACNYWVQEAITNLPGLKKLGSSPM